jgi:hypothetical protein
MGPTLGALIPPPVITAHSVQVTTRSPVSLVVAAHDDVPTRCTTVTQMSVTSNPQLVPARLPAFNMSQLTANVPNNPTSELPPASQPHSACCPPTISPVPVTPAVLPTPAKRSPVPSSRTVTPAHSQTSSYSSTTSQITPLAFDFSSLITPTSFPAHQRAAKHSKPADVPESPTKRHRSAERSSTQSTSRAALLAEPNDAPMDVFNDRGPTVCMPALTLSTHLTTAFADQGKQIVYSSRPLKSAPFNSPKSWTSPMLMISWAVPPMLNICLQNHLVVVLDPNQIFSRASFKLSF